MKKHGSVLSIVTKFFLGFIICLIAFVSFGCDTKKLIETSGETNAGTPIIDREKSSFSIWDVDMIDTPDSSCFSQIGYSSEYEILVVTFRDSETTYLYLDVPEEEWDSFRTAKSLGGYFNRNIKGYYTCNKYD